MKLKANLSYLRAELLGSMEVAPFDTMLVSCQMLLIFFQFGCGIFHVNIFGVFQEC